LEERVLQQQAQPLALFAHSGTVVWQIEASLRVSMPSQPPIEPATDRIGWCSRELKIAEPGAARRRQICVVSGADW
jgi:hypothetical protein